MHRFTGDALQDEWRTLADAHCDVSQCASAFAHERGPDPPGMPTIGLTAACRDCRRCRLGGFAWRDQHRLFVERLSVFANFARWLWYSMDNL